MAEADGSATDANVPLLSRLGDRHTVKPGGSPTNGRPWRANCDMLDARFDLRAVLDYICPEI